MIINTHDIPAQKRHMDTFWCRYQCTLVLPDGSEMVGNSDTLYPTGSMVLLAWKDFGTRWFQVTGEDKDANGGTRYHVVPLAMEVMQVEALQEKWSDPKCAEPSNYAEKLLDECAGG